MLSAGFSADLHRIFERLPKDVQICVFSATFSADAARLAESLLRSPVKIVLKKEEITLAGIKYGLLQRSLLTLARQFYVNVEQEKWKLDTLCDLYDDLSCSQSVSGFTRGPFPQRVAFFPSHDLVNEGHILQLASHRGLARGADAGARLLRQPNP